MKWLVFVLLIPAATWAQDVRLLECGQVSFSLPACVTLLPEEPPPPAVMPEPKEPLFTPENVARDTPKLMLDLLQEPTVEHARKFIDWQQERYAHIRQVQQLLHLMMPKGEQP